MVRVVIIRKSYFLLSSETFFLIIRISLLKSGMIYKPIQQEINIPNKREDYEYFYGVLHTKEIETH